jgi:hypothetical protein
MRDALKLTDRPSCAERGGDFFVTRTMEAPLLLPKNKRHRHAFEAEMLAECAF